MKVKQLIFLLLLIFQFGHTQNEKIINGTVLCEDLPIKDVQVINLSSQKMTITDPYGAFSISAKTEDILVFFSKKHEDTQVFLNQTDLDLTHLVVHLTRSPEALEEVVLTQMNSLKIKFNRASLDSIGLEKAKMQPKIIGLNDGTIANGADITRILGMIWGLFAKPKQKDNAVQMDFKDVIKSKFKDSFFTDVLKINTHQTALFLEFCDADPKSKTVLVNANELSLMDFLFLKNEEFKKLNPEP